MENSNSDLIIKKFVKPGWFGKLLPFLFVVVYFVVYFSYRVGNGVFSLSFFITQLIVLSTIITTIYKFHFRTIKITKDALIYRGLSKKLVIKYDQIQEFFIMPSNVTHKTTHHLFINGSGNFYKFANIQSYPRKNVEYLLDFLADHTNAEYDEDALAKEMNDIVWKERK